MNTPHTPGKWIVNSCGYIGTAPKSDNDTGWTLVACPPEVHEETPYVRLPIAEERAANARLIAAAPELLAEVQRLDAALFTLKMAFGHLSPGLKDALVHHYTKARNVISRATGKE